MKRTVQIYKAASDLTRYRILKLLSGGTACVCELAEALELAQPTVTRHLQALERAGLVTSRRSGQRMDFDLAPDPRHPVAREVLAGVRSRVEDDPELPRFLRRLRAAQAARGREAGPACCPGRAAAETGARP
ncbi:winged helix-turn-helix transcriptional regulator [Dissulfurirhabdus thermomarina]|uniref:Winged helix-turn-helix transcriptional regulator n=1 Tax=Dissulfurirhabdus thermomarina TaxID=1765737 RepID=A0A6N9TQZ8_DISTH|nr:metalloregulator ArsR/SmtB family transcription factor [Dissulfurirhabdus thermomarina]NDY43498.1 winged helix-turn-helix transcriptional regulator [Dissulfurirhabdus thermomarina]NMX23811.1 winged helix-turn-helix transcriptional regulator [Dissulfurirhabdus thermomarina]